MMMRSAAHHLKGRTETIRVVTSESVAFVDAVMAGVNEEEQRDLLKAALKQHSAGSS